MPISENLCATFFTILSIANIRVIVIRNRNIFVFSMSSHFDAFDLSSVEEWQIEQTTGII